MAGALGAIGSSRCALDSPRPSSPEASLSDVRQALLITLQATGPRDQPAGPWPVLVHSHRLPERKRINTTASCRPSGKGPVPETHCSSSTCRFTDQGPTHSPGHRHANAVGRRLGPKERNPESPLRNGPERARPGSPIGRRNSHQIAPLPSQPGELGPESPSPKGGNQTLGRSRKALGSGPCALISRSRRGVERGIRVQLQELVVPNQRTTRTVVTRGRSAFQGRRVAG